MGNINLKIIIILIIIISILSIVLFFIIFRMVENKHKKKELDKIDIKINKSRLKKCDSTLSRIRKIAQSNNKFSNLYTRLSQTWDKMSDNVNYLNNQKSKLLLKYKKISSKKLKIEINNLNQNIELLNNIEKNFNSAAMQVTQQDEFTRSEKSFYNKNFRIAIDVYKDKRVLLDKISHKIDDLTNVISNIDKNFSIALMNANSIEINKLLYEYSQKVISFCNIINKGPALQNYIYKVIPNMLEKLLDLYKNRKKELKISLQHINFVKSIEKISSIYSSAKNHFKILKLEKAEEETRNIIKSIKIIEKMINSEVYARNIFINNFSTIISETRNILIEFVDIKSQIKKIKTKDIKISTDFKESFKEIVLNASIIDSDAINFKRLIQNNKIPFSSKVSRMKLLIQKLNEFVEMINKIKEMIFDLDINKSILKNKFVRTKYAFDELIANIKENAIMVKKEETSNIENLNTKMSESAKKLLKENINQEDIDFIESTIKNTISFYRFIAGSVQIAEIVKNLIRKLSIDRAINNELNYQLLSAEKEYLEGKYATSLNVIIQYLERN